MLHKKIFGDDKNIEIPCLLSESFIRNKMGLEMYEGKDKKFDAQKSNSNNEFEYYEIKGTSSNEGTTTINISNRANYLIWAYFDFANDCIIIRTLFNFNKEEPKLCDFVKKEYISKIKRNKENGMQHKDDDSFFDVFEKDSAGRTTISLHYLKWNQEIKYSMSNGDKIKNN